MWSVRTAARGRRPILRRLRPAGDRRRVGSRKPVAPGPPGGGVGGRPGRGGRAAALRDVGRLLSLIRLAGGYLAVCSARRRAWHDNFSGTVVIDAAGSVIIETSGTPAAPVSVRPVAVPEPSAFTV